MAHGWLQKWGQEYTGVARPFWGSRCLKCNAIVTLRLCYPSTPDGEVSVGTTPLRSVVSLGACLNLLSGVHQGLTICGKK